MLYPLPRQDAARLTGTDRQTLRDWVHRYNEAGIVGLRSRKPPPERAAKLPLNKKAQLHQWVLGGPNPEEHKAVRWRRVDLRGEVARRFSVTVCERAIGK